MTETTWHAGPIEPQEFAPVHTAHGEVIERGWRRWFQADCWVNGKHAITDEIIVSMPRSQVQAYALRLTGEMLPAEAFPRPAPPVTQVVDAGRKLGWIHDA